MIELARGVIEQGGWVLLAILGASALAWTLIVRQWLRLLEPHASGLAGVSTFSGLESGGSSRADFEARVLPLLGYQEVLFDRPLRVIAVLAAAMPLLGLLGTVLGMMQTFDALSGRGPIGIEALAGGISRALITTQAGLIAAIPVALVHRYLASRVRRRVDAARVLVHRLETISAATEAP